MKNCEIPVVLATDENYFYPTVVTLASLMCNASPETKYKIYILVPGEFAENKKRFIRNLANKYDMPQVEFLDMKKAYSDMQMHVAHISYASFYRLQIHTLLTQIEKCIYLDVDILVLGDLADFYGMDISDDYIAGVKAAGFYYPERNVEHMKKNLGIPVFDQYVNAGVLLMNLKKIRADKMEQVFAELLKRDFSNHDQDILNCSCYGHIKILPPVYNAMTKYNVGEKEAYTQLPCLPICYTEQEWKEACENPVIVHYADRWKPWDTMTVFMASEWWHYAQIANIDIDAFHYFLPLMKNKQLEVQKNYEKKISNICSEKQKVDQKLVATSCEKQKLEQELSAVVNAKNILEEKISQEENKRSILEKQVQKIEDEKKLLSDEVVKLKKRVKKTKKELTTLKSRYLVKILLKFDKVKEKLFRK